MSQRITWRVVLRGPWTPELADALASAHATRVSGHSLPGTESHSVLLEAATASDAIAKVKAAVEGLPAFVEETALEFPPDPPDA